MTSLTVITMTKDQNKYLAWPTDNYTFIFVTLLKPNLIRHQPPKASVSMESHIISSLIKIHSPKRLLKYSLVYVSSQNWPPSFLTWRELYLLMEKCVVADLQSRSLWSIIDQINQGTGLHQHLHRLSWLAPSTRLSTNHERGDPVKVPNVDICTVLEQQLDGFHAGWLSSTVQAGLAKAVLVVDNFGCLVSQMFEQDLGGVQKLSADAVMQRHLSPLVVNVWHRSSLQQGSV